ncbi:hypothetical protein C8J57DRAFT_1376373 [Mycena rebaudengoi]|nr:hypothetical protein C8J57DRAFT_1376373 [Mycena rebaudengoi]
MAQASAIEACDKLDARIQAFSDDPNVIEDDAHNRHKPFLSMLSEACAIAQSADRDHPGFLDVLERVSGTINDMIDLAYGKLDIDFLPSYAHSEDRPVLDGLEDQNVISYRMKGIIAILEQFVKSKGGDDASPLDLRLPEAWQETYKPHASSSRLGRFNGTPALPAATFPLAEIIYGARCEISSDSFSSPVSLASAGDCIAAYHLQVGLSEIAFSSTIDANRKFIFLADSERVKSYAWADAQTGGVYKEPLATHTLRMSKHHGPLAVLASERFIRAGTGSAAVWNLSELKTHGPDGSKRIGKRFDTSDTWRDEDDEIEDSSGSAPSSSLKFADAKLRPSRWHAHPSLPFTMLCASDPSKTRDYSCVSVDLEHGGKTVERFSGHGGEIYALSASTGDPHAFVTAASDGYARLFDTRRTNLPVLTVSAGTASSDICSAALLVDPDGVPTIFTGAEKEEVIRLWDVRAAKMVYELATGNNEVVGLTWDDERNVLYATTSCGYVDRNGYNHGYRRAKIPRDEDTDGDDDPMSDEEYDDEDEDDEDDDHDHCWPAEAAHSETYFGHVFDAGEHRILRYAFKENPDSFILPPYGQATEESDSYW